MSNENEWNLVTRFK